MKTDSSLPPYLELLWNHITIEFMIKFFVIYFFVVWVALTIWVAKDISLRTNSRVYQVLAVLFMIFLTPLGIFLYLLIRPGKSMYERYAEEIEENLEILNEIVQERMQEENILACPHCQEDIEEDFVCCPQCKNTLIHYCQSCEKEIREGWKVCPYCQTKQKKKKKK